MAVALCFPASASAQRPGETILFSEPDFRGRSFTVRGQRDILTLPWTVRSIRVVPTEVWDVCTRIRFRGSCNRVAQNMRNVRWTVASVRPSQTVTFPEPVPPALQRSLRGMSAEFFVAPADNRGRIVSCASGGHACARESAERFCRARGWGGVSYFRQETVNRTNFLTDMLCTMTGGSP